MTHNPLRSCTDHWGQKTLREIFSVRAQLNVMQAPSFSSEIPVGEDSYFPHFHKLRHFSGPGSNHHNPEYSSFALCLYPLNCINTHNAAFTVTKCYGKDARK